MRFTRVYLLLLSFGFVGALDKLHASSEIGFQNIVNTASYLSKHTGISLGVALPDHVKTIAVSAGYKDRKKAIPITPEDRMGIGSNTKTITAAAMLKTIQNGGVKLDDMALPHFDWIVRKVTSKSATEYLGPDIQNVTVRHLLHMTSGIGDFDSHEMRVRMINHPSMDTDLDTMLGEAVQITNREQYQLKQRANSFSSFSCFPGTCGEYSSTNYLLLGLILAQQAGVQHWSEYDQSSFLPDAVRKKMPHTLFPMKGALRDFTDVHGYVGTAPGAYEKIFVDSFDWAANLGFTVGNALSTGPDMANFMHSLLGKNAEIIDAQHLNEMMKLRWLETGLGNKVSTGQFYGMGVRDMSAQLSMNALNTLMNPEIFFAGLLYGHDGGSPLGFNSFSAYAPRHDFGLSYIINDGRAIGQFCFLTRKSYDLASGMTKPVADPLQATLENKDAFMSQKIVRKLKKLSLKMPL